MPKPSLLRFVHHLKDRIRLNKRSFIVYTVLRLLVILTAVRCLLQHNYESFAACMLSLVLFLLPSFFEEQLKVEIPPLFESIIYLFIFAAEILGEVNRYYTAIPGWDTMLHTLNGFLCAAIGFSLVYVLNRQSKNLNLTPAYLAIAAFCFSMTVGVMWEFIEFAADWMFGLDMQKDFFTSTVSSVRLDPNNAQVPYHIGGIVRTILETGDGEHYVIEGGYLDIGIIDTMKDLFVNFIGAVAFSTAGYFYAKADEKHRGKNFAGRLLLRPLTDEEIAAQQEAIREENEKLHRKLRPKR